MVSVAFNVFLAVALAFWLDWGVTGIAVAAALAAIVEVIILFSIMSIRLKGLFDMVFAHAVARMMSATGFRAIVTYGMVLWLPLQGGEQSFFTTFPSFALIAFVSMAAYVLLCMMLKLEEPVPVIAYIKRMFFGRVGR